MAFTRISQNMDYIAALDDKPNDVGGLSAQALKEEFDRAGNYLKGFINNTLLSEMESSSAAGSIGISTIDEDFTATNVQDALEELYEEIGSVSVTGVADGTVTTAKLADTAVTTAKLADNSVTAAKIKDYEVGTNELANLAVTSDKIQGSAVTGAKIADGAVSKAKLAGSAVGTSQLDTSDLLIPVACGGTGANNADDALSQIGAQKAILSNSFSLTVADWAASGNVWTQSVTVSGMSASKCFVASPSDATSWDAAADATLYPPTAGNNTLTYTCKEKPDAAISVTVYFW